MTEGLALVLGGARSGKSRYAEALVSASGLRRTYIATAERGDAEMASRIAHHRESRGPEWRTVEEPLRLEEALTAETGPDQAVLVDCLTLWLSNLMLAETDVEARSRELCAVALRTEGLRVLVSNEVGMGLVPDTPLGRRFRDAQGRLNQAVAAVADRVVFLAAGLPLILKGAPS